MMVRTIRLHGMNTSTESIARVFIDTNVAIDLVTKRQPFYDEAKFVLDFAKMGSIEPVISSGSIVTMIYVAFDRYKLPYAEELLWKFIEVCSVVNTGKGDVFSALHSTFRDKEDAIQYYTALAEDVDYLVTRDKKDFKIHPSILPILTPIQLEYMLI